MSKSDAEQFFGRPEFERGKYGWAKIKQADGSEKLYRRATTIAGYMEDKEGLIGWKSAMAAFGFAKSKSLLSALSVLDWKNDKDKVKDIVGRAQSLGGGDDAADLGTAFHRVIERHVAGEVIDYDSLPDGFGDALDAFIGFQKDFGITVVGSEITVVDDAHEIAGTADAIIAFGEDIATPFGKIKAGTGVIGDWKTGSVSELSGLKMSQQLSIYSHADPYHAQLGERTAWPVEINPDIGLILKVDLEKGEVIPWWLDLKAAYEWIDLSLKVSATRTKAKKAIAQANIALSKGTNADTVEALGAREVGKLITAASCVAELDSIKKKHGQVFTDTMEKRWEEKRAEFSAANAEAIASIAEIVETPPEEPAEKPKAEPEHDYRKEANAALGAAETVDQLRAAWKTFAPYLTDEQKAFAKKRSKELELAEAEPETVPPEEEATAPVAGAETQVEMPDWMGVDEPAAKESAEVEPYSVEDAKTREVANLGEMRDLFREFHKALQAGKSSPEALAVIAERGKEFK